MRFKDFVQASVRRAGYDIIRRPHQVSHPFNLLDLLIRDALTRTPNFFFVQVGANDGVRVDPLRASILRHQLHGLLIEPLPDLFDRLRANYAGQPGLLFENCAISETPGRQRMFRVRADAPLPDGVHGLASFDRSNLTASRQGVPGLDAYVEEISVAARTLSDVLAQHQVSQVSLLMIDTEGYDAAIIKMALEADVRPPIVVYEHVNLPIATQSHTLERLHASGYQFLEIGMDTYALATDSLG